MSIPFRYRNHSTCIKLAGASMLACATVLILASDAQASWLDRVTSVSFMGQPLYVEIMAPGATAEYVSRCARLVTPNAAPDGIPTLRDARLSITGSGIDARLAIAHATPVHDPIVHLAIRDLCDSQHQREFTLLLPVATSTAPAASTASASAHSPTFSRTSSDIYASDTWTTVAGESIASLVQALHPHNARARQQLTEKLFELNPSLLRDRLTATTSLPPGTQLRVPSPAALFVITPEPRKQPSRDIAPVPDSSSRLVLQGEADEQSATNTAAKAKYAHKNGAPQDASEEMRIQRLVKAVDNSIRAELELLERLRRLEEIEQAIRAQFALPVPQPLKSSAPPVAAKIANTAPERTPFSVQTPASQAATTTWAQWMLLLAALITVVSIILFYEIRYRLRTRPLQHSTDIPVAKQEQNSAADTDADAITQISATHPDNPTMPTSDWSNDDITITISASELPTAAASMEFTAATQPSPIRSDLDFDTEITDPWIINEEITEGHDSALELADIMISFGRVQGAAETLSDFIRAKPRQSVAPWIKLLEVYRLADMRVEFDALARKLNKTFNVKAVTWDNFDEARTMSGGLEQLPHAIEQLITLWDTVECQAYLDKMLRDNRDGTRQGLSLGIIDDILMLWSVLEEKLGHFRGEHLRHTT